jgi:hypothetical protein
MLGASNVMPYAKMRLSIKCKCSNFIDMILCPFIFRSGRHFNIIALLKIKCRSYALAMWAMATNLLAHGRGLHRHLNRSSTWSSSQNMFPLATLFTVFIVVGFRFTLYRIVEDKLDLARVLWRFPSVSYIV